MNIALFTDQYLPTKSGVVTVVVQLKKILEELGHNVVIVTVMASLDGYEESEDPNILRVYSIPAPVGTGQYIGFPHRRAIVKFLEKHNVQLIHAHTEFFVGQIAVRVGKYMNIPVIATTHTMWEDYYRYYLSFGKLISRRLIRKIVKKLYKRFYALINVSEKAHKYFTNPFMLPGIPSAIIPNAIDSEKFNLMRCTEQDKVELRAKLGIKENDRVLLYVGRIVEEKRLFELLEVIKRIVSKRDNVKMVFVGAGVIEDDLREEVQNFEYADKIIFTGFVDWMKLAPYYAIGDIFVTASLSEMHSMTVLEAMSLGLPVICRKDDSFSDTVLQGKTGYMAASDQDMDKFLLCLIDNPEKCRQMGERAFELSKNFSLLLHGKRTEAFYQEVLRNFPKRMSSSKLQQIVNQVKSKK